MISHRWFNTLSIVRHTLAAVLLVALAALVGPAAAADSDNAASAAADVAAAQKRLSEARLKLDQFVRQRFDHLRSTAPTTGEEDGAAALSAADLPVAVQDPLRARLESELLAMATERNELLLRLTPEHPSIQSLDVQIEDVERQIRALPAVPPPAAPVAAAPAAADAGAQQEAWREQLAVSEAEYEQLVAACRQAQQELDRLAANQVEVAQAIPVTVAATPPTLSETQPAAGSSGTPAVVLVGWGAAAMLLLAGSIRLALIWQARRPVAVVSQPGTLEQRFQLPVLGVIGPDTTASTDERRGGRAVAGRLAVFCCQFALAASVFLLIAVTVKDPHWLLELPTRPLTAFGQAFGKL